MMLWFLGFFAFSSAYLSVAFATVAWKNRKPLSWYNAPLVLAVSLDIHAFGLTYWTVVRVLDVADGYPLDGLNYQHLMAAYVLVALSKFGFVWLSCMRVVDGRPSFIRRQWYGFLAATVIWTGYVTLLHDIVITWFR